MDELAAFLVVWPVTVAVPYAVIRYDRAKLRARGEDHPWNAATVGCAVFWFQLLAIPAHYWALRRPRAAALSLLALGGLVATLAVLGD